jgi:hypothetical protein
MTEGSKMLRAGKPSDRLRLKWRGKTEGFKMLRARKLDDSRRP